MLSELKLREELSEVFIKFQVVDGHMEALAYEHRDDKEPIACLTVVPSYLALESVEAFMPQLSHTLCWEYLAVPGKQGMYYVHH